MQQNVTCLDHGKQMEYLNFHVNSKQNLFCEECIKTQNIQHTVVRIDKIRDKVINELKNIKQQQEKYQNKVRIIQNSLISLKEKEQQLCKVIDDIDIYQFQNIQDYIQKFYRINNGDIQTTFNQQFFQDTKPIDQLQRIYTFSNEYKNDSIILLNKFTIQQNKVIMNSLAVIDPILDQQQESSIYFKINHIGQSVAIGFCELEVIKQQQYQISNWNSLGHGCYLISSGGYTYNSKDWKFNFKKIGFCFNQNQIIKISHDPLNNLIIFEKLNESKSQIEMNINAQNLYACVYVSKPKDEIEILNF
ncbi:unnamed protein product [Paramecium pentaurelia]|uniref:Uncharacterized protein n=1 Tax=Paramecium pentaurelia TaxID=43138 RepID=A0A8S1UW42_9CILI|nr:unnamed protein product [Paramecium pentaurelia]